jgi:hypothetical protein
MRILRKSVCYAIRMADESRLRPAQRGKEGDRLNVYIAAADRELFRRAQEFAATRGVSVSSVVADALARYLAHPPKG